jgi:excisionase family DNA binding protein
MPRKFLRVEDVSKQLDISKSTVYLYVSKNHIPHIKIGGKLYFTKSDLTNWINQNRRLPDNLKTDND